MTNLFEFSIYTMRSRNDLDYIFSNGGRGEFSEKKPWRKGKELFNEALSEDKRMPILLSAAEEESGLIFFGILESIAIDPSNKNTTYSFSDLRRIPNPKPLSSLTLRSTGKPISNNYIRPYAICTTPKDYKDWFEEKGLPPLIKERKSGSERFSFKENISGFSLLEFWQWSVSDLVSNASRGILAEYIVAKALGVADDLRQEWGAFDLLLKDGTKIEVKSSAYVQSWYQREYSSIRFGIQKTREWDAITNRQSEELKRQADIYIFSVLGHKIQHTLNPLALEQWTFYILPTSELDLHMKDRKGITLNKLKQLKPIRADFRNLKEKVQLAIDKLK